MKMIEAQGNIPKRVGAVKHILKTTKNLIVLVKAVVEV
jgi:hypothetical protein